MGNSVHVVALLGVDSHHNRLVRVKCYCGTLFVARRARILTGRTRSCGCLKKLVNKRTAKLMGQSSKKHGHWIGGHASRTYRTWRSMKQRCLYRKADSYKYYGARGIKITPAWVASFSAFLQDMGERPKGTSLDRINPELGYNKENCRWATAKEQRHNWRLDAKRKVVNG